MSDVTCPECDKVLRARAAVLTRIPGKAPSIYVDYECDAPDCAGSQRIYVPRQVSRESATDSTQGPNPAA